ncbi:MAG: hypothetical protein Q8N63_06250 [Nanoarchaeota archaeon]|nr:hypothetical protein [Nanoarchaeota archaeon]
MEINTSNLAEARKQIQKLKKENKEVIVRAQEPEFNRKILEIKEVDILLSPEIHNRKDKLKERDSGLNEILCKIAAKNNIKIGIDIEEIKKTQGKEKAIILARIIQNIMLCKKTKAELKLMNCKEKDKRGTFSLLLTLGASTSQAKNAIE